MSDAIARRCDNCGEPFTVRRKGQRFCPGSTCRQQAWDKAHPRVPIATGVRPVRVTLIVDLGAGATRIESVEVVES